MINDLEKLINELFNTPSDINEHISTLIKYGSECEHITEMGVRWVVSTWAFLGAAPKVLKSYDMQDPSTWNVNIQDVYDTSKKLRVPSWTDRILFKSENCVLKYYNRREHRFSDHRPVLAIFECKVKKTNYILKDQI